MVNSPHTKEERALIDKGYQYIAGIDEVGRGALAGPVVAAAVIMPIDKRIKNVKDSKLLSPKAREELYEEIIDKCLAYGVGQAEHLTIDKINIYQATKLAMKRAVDNLQIKPSHLLIDAMKVEVDIPQKSIIKGDMICYSIAAASIIAKVTRDRLMVEMHDRFPNYNFEKHKGYATKIHKEALKTFGPCQIHRLTFCH